MQQNRVQDVPGHFKPMVCPGDSSTRFCAGGLVVPTVTQTQFQETSYRIFPSDPGRLYDYFKRGSHHPRLLSFKSERKKYHLIITTAYIKQNY